MGPRKGRIKWTFQPDGGGIIWPAVVIGPDSTVYFSAHRVITPKGQEVFLYAVRPDGSLKWKYPLTSSSTHDGSALVLADGSILVPRLGHWYDPASLLILNPDGSVRRNIRFNSPSQPNIGLDGTLFLVDRSDALCAITLEGAVKWRLTVDGGFSWQGVALSPDGTTLYGFPITPSSAGTVTYRLGLCAVGTEGAAKWRFTFPDSTQTPCAALPVVDCQGRIYFGTVVFKEGFPDPVPFHSISPSGELNWSLSAYGSWFVEPAIDAEGNIYFYSAWSDPTLVCVDCQGQFRWSGGLSHQPYASPVCDAEGVVYVPEKELVAFDRNGSVLWKVALEGDFSRIAAPAIGADGTLYLGTHGSNSRLYAIE